MEYFTGDKHLGHANITAYCHRFPFKDEYVEYVPSKHNPDKLIAQWIDDEVKEDCMVRSAGMIIANHNARISEHDTVYDLGDFCMKGNAEHGNGWVNKAEEWQSRLHGRVVQIQGNHDSHNGVVGARLMVIHLSKMWRNVILVHDPHDAMLDCIDMMHVSAIICGHVHTDWVTNWRGRVPVVNVGVDVHDMRPVSKPELITILDRMVGAKEEDRIWSFQPGYIQSSTPTLRGRTVGASSSASPVM